MLLEKLIGLECSLHGEMRKDREWLEQILHKEFREITRTGVLGKVRISGEILLG